MVSLGSGTSQYRKVTGVDLVPINIWVAHML